MNNSFNEKIDRINIAKENIKTSLINKGLSPSDNIEDYASLIEKIEQGSGSGSTIKIYNSIEAMQDDKATMNQNDICEIHENYEYICPLSFLGEGDEVSFDNVIIPTQFIIGKLSASALTLKYANPEGTEHLTFKKAVLNTTKLTLTYKLANQDEVSHVYTYSDTVAGYVSDLSETLILNFNSTLSLVTDASLGSVKSRINTKLNKEVLTYVYKFNNGDFEVLQGFNDTVATVVSDIGNVHLGKDGDLALALIKPNESIKPDVSYNFITFKPEINKSDITVGDYSVDIEVQVDAPAVIPSTVNRLSFIVTDATITISLQISLMGITALSYADITYTLEGDKYKLTDPQVWEVRGDISLSMIGDMKIEGFKIPTDSWNDVYTLILNGAPEFKGIYEYNNVTKSLHLAPNQFTALAKDIKQGKNAYSLEGVTEGTAADLGTVEITATKESQSLSGGFVDKIKVKAVDATIDENIQPDNIKSGLSILGVEGSDRLSVIKFNSLEEARAYDKFKFNDKAIIIDTVDVPFYPDFLHTDYPNFSSYSYSGSMQEMLYEPFILLPRDQVTLDEITALSAEASYTTTGTKAKTYGFKIEISSSECRVTVFCSFLGSNDVVFKYVSTDGLTYTLNEVTNSGSTVTYIKYASLYWSSTYLGYVYDALIENWDNIKLISKFLYYPQKEQLKGIYTYLPASSISTNNTPFYLIDLNKVIYKNNAARLSLLEKSYTGQQFIDYATAAGLTDSDRGYAILKDGRVIMTAYPLIIKDNKGNYFFGSSNSATSHTIYNPADGTVTTGTNVEGYNYGPYTGMKIIDISEVEVIVRRTSYDSVTKWANPAIYYVEDTSQTNTPIYGIYGGYYAKSNPQLIPFDGYRSDLDINNLLINGASSISAQEEIELNNVLDNIYGGAE